MNEMDFCLALSVSPRGPAGVVGGLNKRATSLPLHEDNTILM